MVEHAASIYNRYVCTEDGSTPYQNVHGQRFRGRAVEFGEQVFYYVPKRLRAKMSLRWRLGTFVGNHQNSNEALVASSTGDVIKVRSIVRVVASSRWNKDTAMGVKGTPFRLRPRSDSETDAHVEEAMEPHTNSDQHPSDDDLKEFFDKDEVKKLDRQLRITKVDIDQFGLSEDCPKCADLRRGKMTTTKLHSDSCRLRFYLQFKEANHPKWQAVKHLFEDHDDSPKFQSQQVDKEGAAAAPPALFESEPLKGNGDLGMDDDAFDMAIDRSLEREPLIEDEADVADMFTDDLEDVIPEDAMVDALLMAGVAEAQAKVAAHQMMALRTRPTFIEAYGKTITDYTNAHRRNLNVQGLASLDLRSPKPNGEQWDFCKSADRREARRMVKELDPDWIIGAPPCTAFSIWNYGLNYKKMSAEAVRAKLEEGRLHLKFVASLYELQIQRG